MARLVIGGGTTGAGIAYADALDKARARALTEMQLHMEAANAEANRAQNEKMAARQEAFQTGIEQGRQQHAAELQRGELTARQEEARLARAQGMEQFTTTEGRLKDQAAKASAIDEARLAIDEARLTLERLKQEGAPREVMESTATKAGANWSYDPALSRGQNEANLRAALSVKEKENIALKVAIDNELDLAGLPITPTNVTWAMKQKKIEERRAAWEKAGLEMGVVAPGGKPGEAAIKQEMMQKINQVYGDKLKALDEDNRIKVLNIVAEQGRAAASLGEPFDYPKALQQAMQFISPGKVKGGEGIPPSAPPTAIERAKAWGVEQKSEKKTQAELSLSYESALEKAKEKATGINLFGPVSRWAGDVLLPGQPGQLYYTSRLAPIAEETLEETLDPETIAELRKAYWAEHLPGETAIYEKMYPKPLPELPPWPAGRAGPVGGFSRPRRWNE